MNRKSFKRKQANPQQANGKGKKPFQSRLSKASEKNHAKIRNHRRTMARDVTENEIINILMYFIETRQLGLELESARKDKLQTRSPTNYLYVLKTNF